MLGSSEIITNLTSSLDSQTPEANSVGIQKLFLNVNKQTKLICKRIKAEDNYINTKWQKDAVEDCGAGFVQIYFWPEGAGLDPQLLVSNPGSSGKKLCKEAIAVIRASLDKMESMDIQPDDEKMNAKQTPIENRTDLDAYVNTYLKDVTINIFCR